MKHGFVKVAAATPRLEVANCLYNAEQIQQFMLKAHSQDVEVLCFPELSLTGYTCQDLFRQQTLIEEEENALLRLVDFSRNISTITIVGLPVALDNWLFDCAAVIHNGHLIGLVPKTHTPHHESTDNQRWFASAEILAEGKKTHLCGQEVPVGGKLLFSNGAYSFGIELGNATWSTIPQSTLLTQEGADIIFNPTASCEMVGKAPYVLNQIVSHSGRCICGYVYVSSGFGESTQDAVYAGRSYIAENAVILAEGKPFSLEGQLIISEIDINHLRHERRANVASAQQPPRLSPHCLTVPLTYAPLPDREFILTRPISAHPFIPEGELLDDRCEEILFIQSQGLAKRILHTHADTVVVGVSGGLDSTLALLVCVHAFDRLERDRKGIVGITMPGFGTTGRTYNNAVRLMKNLGITIREIGIADACRAHLEDLGHDTTTHDTTYENAQARERTQVLMDAANQTNGFVVGTGDLSELALGWATYNGDHMSMYGVNAGIPKTLIRHIVQWIANNLVDEFTKEVLLDIVATPISPELIPANADGTIQQKTEDLVGPYELHDFFLYHTLRHGFGPQKTFWLAQQAFAGTYGHDTIKKWLRTFFRRFIQQQYKRSCMPDGPKVGSCSLSPRGDWQMPSDAAADLWLKECDEL